MNDVFPGTLRPFCDAPNQIGLFPAGNQILKFRLVGSDLFQGWQILSLPDTPQRPDQNSQLLKHERQMVACAADLIKSRMRIPIFFDTASNKRAAGGSAHQPKKNKGLPLKGKQVMEGNIRRLCTLAKEAAGRLIRKTGLDL